MALEGYDLVMLGILAGAALLGYFKGMVWQVAWIAGIVVSSFVALRFGGQFAPHFGNQAPWNRFAAMLACYVATSLAVWLLFRTISGAINAVHLSAFDKQLGLLLGLAKGALLCVVITFFGVTLAPAYRGQIITSKSGRLVASLIVRADEFLPPQVHETVEPFVRQFEQQFAPQSGMAGFDGGPAVAGPAFGRPPAAAPAGQASPLKALWDGLTASSAAAWAGAEQGGGGPGASQPAGVLPAGASWVVPRAGENAGPGPATVAAPQRTIGAGWSVPQTPADQRFAPPPAAAPFSAAPPSAPPQRFAQPAAAPLQPPPSRYQQPAAYPVGAQSPLPRR